MAVHAPGHPADGDLTQERVAALLTGPRSGSGSVIVVPATGSTNADLLARHRAGQAPDGTVLAAGEQTAGRGRLHRAWSSPPGTSLSFSMVLQPPIQRAGFVPPLTAIAVAKAIAAVSGLRAALKWPNDIMLGDAGTEGKVAGILAEGTPAAVVVGCGVNVTIPADRLPVPTATSIQLHGPRVGRSELLVACVTELDAAYGRWREAGFDAEASGLLAAYRGSCSTIGRLARVVLPDGSDVVGTATGIDDLGRLVLLVDGRERVMTAGDVVHLRPVG